MLDGKSHGSGMHWLPATAVTPSVTDRSQDVLRVERRFSWVAVQSTGHQGMDVTLPWDDEGMRRVDEIITIVIWMTGFLRLSVQRRSDFGRHDREAVGGSLEAIDAGVDADRSLTRCPPEPIEHLRHRRRTAQVTC